MENLNQESVNNHENGESTMENPCEPESMRKLFIGGLAYSTTTDRLQSYFEKFGTVVDVIAVEDSTTKQSRGFGFVTFSSSSMADNVQAARPHSIDGRVVNTKRAVPRNEGSRPETSVQKVFISGINKDHEDDDLRQYFSQFGNVIQVTIKCEAEKRHGFAFVEFDDYDAVDKVLLQKEHIVKGTTLYVKKSIPKMDMDRRNSSQSNSGGRNGNGRQGGKGQSRNGGMNQGENAYNNGYGENNHGSNGRGNGDNRVGNFTNGWNGSNNGWNGNSNMWNGNNNMWNGNNNGCNGNNNGWNGNNNMWNGNNNGCNGNNNGWNGNNSFRNFDNEFQGGFNSGAIRNNFTQNNRMNPYGNGNFGADGRNNFNQGHVGREGGRRF